MIESPCRGAGAYAIAPVAERAASAAHMQLISGCSPAAYWGGHAVWDVATHATLSALSIAIFAAFGDGATTGSVEKVQCDAPLQRFAVTVGPLAMPQVLSDRLGHNKPER